MKNQRKKSFILVSVASTLLISIMSGCAPSLDSIDKNDRNRIKACSVGFSENVALAVIAAFDEAAVTGTTKADFKNKIRSIIFPQLSTQDQLKKFDDFITCIEQVPSQGSVPVPSQGSAPIKN